MFQNPGVLCCTLRLTLGSFLNNTDQQKVKHLLEVLSEMQMNNVTSFTVIPAVFCLLVYNKLIIYLGCPITFVYREKIRCLSSQRHKERGQTAAGTGRP